LTFEPAGVIHYIVAKRRKTYRVTVSTTKKMKLPNLLNKAKSQEEKDKANEKIQKKYNKLISQGNDKSLEEIKVFKKLTGVSYNFI
jgi:hypothetical protein